jgi:hypothetical protein
MTLQCKLFLHYINSQLARYLFLLVLVVSFVVSPTIYLSNDAYAAKETSSNEVSEKLKSAIDKKNEQVFSLFRKLPSTERRQISSAIFGALLKYNVFKIYLNSNQSVQETFPVKTIESEDGTSKNYYVITSNSVSAADVSAADFEQDAEFSILADEKKLNDSENNLSQEISATTTLEENIDPVTQSLKEEMNDQQKERFSKLIKLLNNGKVVLGIRFAGQTILITAGLMYLNNFAFAPAFLKGFLGGSFSILFGILDRSADLYSFLNISKNGHNKKVNDLKEKINYYKNIVNTDSSVQQDTSINLPHYMQFLEKNLTRLRTDKGIKLKNYLSFTFFYSLTELSFMTGVHSVYNAISGILNKVSNHFMGNNIINYFEGIVPIDWMEGLIFASFTQGTMEGQVTNYKVELDYLVKQGKMSFEKAQAIYSGLRTLSSLLSVSSTILAQSGARWSAAAGFGSLMGVTLIINKKKEKLENERLGITQIYNQCLEFY